MAASESCDGGVEEFVESIPNLRFSSAFSARSAATSADSAVTNSASCSYDGAGCSGGTDTATMIDDQANKIKPDTPHQPQLNPSHEWTLLIRGGKCVMRIIQRHQN
ncbi:hypothetical protein [Saccharopolyspora sp. ASAGF58]|uniref:hypothetical protein n=1 Tax=Saccharopolyspora sp. ASAGF58 TaxID=2719023 RepID=UPI00143FCAD9|nr:hypothetical protein [Saccharopolyspora sp. ASAGF58]QIZ37061.1 hypothetical protein FDZ84_23485 [Saccharopolyspora sp. ASAGF58]